MPISTLFEVMQSEMNHSVVFSLSDWKIVKKYLKKQREKARFEGDYDLVDGLTEKILKVEEIIINIINQIDFDKL